MTMLITATSCEIDKDHKQTPRGQQMNYGCRSCFSFAFLHQMPTDDSFLHSSLFSFPAECHEVIYGNTINCILNSSPLALLANCRTALSPLANMASYLSITLHAVTSDSSALNLLFFLYARQGAVLLFKLFLIQQNVHLLMFTGRKIGRI